MNCLLDLSITDIIRYITVDLVGPSTDLMQHRGTEEAYAFGGGYDRMRCACAKIPTKVNFSVPV
jgi:hypothetical protein